MQDYFYGWYLKCQSKEQTLALIPAIHQNGGKRTCSIQIITEEFTEEVTYPSYVYRQTGRFGTVLKPVHGQAIVIGENIFCEKGMRLAIHRPDCMMEGVIHFKQLMPLKYDIMGPFALVPFMECRHSVYSMQHTVNGKVFLNGKRYEFCNADGYWEGDRGTSFPKEYLWTQCHFDGGSLMLSVADIPMCGGNFTGVIGVVYWQNREYRFATYLGARVCLLGNGGVCIEQGDMRLEAKLVTWSPEREKTEAKGLRAPFLGEMSRTIHENVACHAAYHFRKGEEVELHFETERAAFEYEFEQ